MSCVVGELDRETIQVDNGAGPGEDVHAENAVDGEAVVHAANLVFDVFERSLADGK